MSFLYNQTDFYFDITLFLAFEIDLNYSLNVNKQSTILLNKV